MLHRAQKAPTFLGMNTPNPNHDGYLEELGCETDAMIADEPEASPSDIARWVLKHRSDSYQLRSVVEAMAAVGLRRAQEAADEASAIAENDRERREVEMTDGADAW